MAVTRLQTVRLINDISDMVSSQRLGISINQDIVETQSTITFVLYNVGLLCGGFKVVDHPKMKIQSFSVSQSLMKSSII